MKQIKNNKYEIIEKKSTFITYTFQISNTDEVEKFTNMIKKKHLDARHIVFAYVLDKDTYRFYDDGEPRQTAGKPIFNVLEKNDFIFSLVVVVRYFGGIKLGAGGLIRAYPKGLKQLISNNDFIEYIPRETYNLVLTIKEYNKVDKYIGSFTNEIEFKNLNVHIIFNISNEEYQTLSKKFNLNKIS